MDIDGDGGRRALGLRVQLRGTGSLREPPQISGQGKIAAQQQISAGQVLRLEKRALEGRRTTPNKQWVQTVKNCWLTP